MPLTLIKRLPKDSSFSGNNQYRALVRCDCGKEYETGYFSYSKSPGCRSCSKKSRYDNFSVSKMMLGRVRKSAKQRNIDFDLSLDDLKKQYSLQILPGEDRARCFYSGRVLFNNGSTDYNISIDRHDSNLGYTADNIVLCTKEVNVAKHTMTESEFLFQVVQMTRPIIIGFTSPTDMPFKSKFSKCVFDGDRFAGIKAGAVHRKIDFDITVDDVNRAFDAQGGRCAFSGAPLMRGNASVDRIDNQKGYTKGNIQLVTKELNFMRHSLTIEDFRTLVDDIYGWNFVNFKQKGNESI